MLVIGISTLPSERLSHSTLGMPSILFYYTNLSYLYYRHNVLFYTYTLTLTQHVLLSLCNTRFQGQRFSIDLPAPPVEESPDTQETIVIEHKTLQELNEIDPYDFLVLSMLPGVSSLFIVTWKAPLKLTDCFPTGLWFSLHGHSNHCATR